MLFTIQHYVLGLWNAWSGLFKPLPYGDPYLAVAALFVLIIVGWKLAMRTEA